MLRKTKVNIKQLQDTLNSECTFDIGRVPIDDYTGWLCLDVDRHIHRFTGTLTIETDGYTLAPTLTIINIICDWNGVLATVSGELLRYDYFDKLAFHMDKNGMYTKIFVHYKMPRHDVKDRWLNGKIKLSSIHHDTIKIIGAKYIAENDITNHISTPIYDIKKSAYIYTDNNTYRHGETIPNWDKYKFHAVRFGITVHPNNTISTMQVDACGPGNLQFNDNRISISIGVDSVGSVYLNTPLNNGYENSYVGNIRMWN